MATYYANATTGSDSNNGTSAATPKATLNAALALTSNGDTIVLAPSTTDYSFTSITRSDITIRCDVKPNPVKGIYARINGLGDSGQILANAGNGSFFAENIWIHRYAVGAASNTSFINIGNGALTTNRVIEFKNCIISNCSGDGSTGTRGGFIGRGGSLSGGTSATSTVRFLGCLLYDNTLTLVRMATGGMVQFENCTVHNISNTAFELVHDSVSVVSVKNCIINQLGTNPTRIFSMGTGSSGTGSNGAYTMQGSVYQNIITASGAITNSTSGDPQFLDPDNYDMRLKPDSPAINRGVL